MEQPLIVVAGESLIDRIVRPDGRVDEVPGGGPFTTARALARLGCRVAFLGRLSTDARGRVLRDTLAADGVDLSLAPATDEPTLIATASVDGAGVATYRFEPPGSAAAGLLPADLADGLPSDTIALHVGTLGLVLEPIATTLADLGATVSPDVVVMVDPNIRPDAIANEALLRARLAGLLARADVVKVSVDDLAWLEPAVDPADAARGFLGRDPAVALVTDGPRPVQVVSVAGWRRTVDVPVVSVVDTIGAGDAFGAGFLAAWLEAGRGRAALGDAATVEAAVLSGVAAAVWTLGRRGADPPRSIDLDGTRAMR